LLCHTSPDQPYEVLETLHLYGTYQDWLLGRPKPNEMADIVKDWETNARRLYPHWPVHSAVDASDYDERGYLPRFVCIGYFTASETRDPQMSGSALVIIWYQAKCPVDGLTLPPIAKSVWQDSAKDFEY